MPSHFVSKLRFDVLAQSLWNASARRLRWELAARPAWPNTAYQPKNARKLEPQNPTAAIFEPRFPAVRFGVTRMVLVSALSSLRREG